ncbi:MAG: ATP-binding protein [Polyangiales bacterium]
MLYPDDLLSEVQRLARFGITQMDVRTGVATWSDEVYRLYGWEIGEVEPKLEALMSRVYPGDEKRVRAAFARAHKAQAQSPLEFRIVRPDGELRSLQVRAKLFSDAAGVPIRMLYTTIDITEHKETAARLVFTDRMASVGTLAAGVAHEINNPLAFISAHLELITNEAPLTADAQTMLAETRGGVERIRNIVRGLSAFSHTGEDRHTPTSVEQVLDLAALMAGPQIRHRAQLERASGALPEVIANQATLGQVFLNILINATEAIPEGQVDRNTISISTRTDDAGWAVVEIRDTGCGIAPEIRGQIFDPFFTTKPIGKGTGLGLSICHGIVRSLGGEIGFISSPGAGTTFTIALPPAVAPAQAIPEPIEMATPLLVTQHAQSKVMIIDDEVVFANALRRLLGRDNHQITIVHEGREALARIAAGERFDAILCDLMMPAMSGMELHEKIVAIAPDLAERMIFLTGGAFSPLAKQFLDRANNLWFDKPCDLQALRSAIVRVARR